MRYMMLIYGRESDAGLSEAETQRVLEAHRVVLRDASAQGILVGAEPLAPTRSATTVRMQDGRALITDGPFAETKEQLAGYYILDCANLDEAIEWASRIPSECSGGTGCIEVRPMPGRESRTE